MVLEKQEGSWERRGETVRAVKTGKDGWRRREQRARKGRRWSRGPD